MRLNWRKDTKLYVEFLDISVDPTWKTDRVALTRPPAIDTDARCVGFFSKVDKEFLYLSNMILGEGGPRDRTVIPIGCIKKVKKLEFLRGTK